MMVMATPLSSPIRIGRERKSASTPSLKRLAMRHQKPVMAVMVITSCH